MDAEIVEAMNNRADKVIAGWSFVALGANLLPPPFDMVVVGGVFAGMGSHIADAYDVKISPKVLRNLGVALAQGVGAVLAGYYVSSGLLKFVPGVNVWVALLIQPPVVGAVSYAAGHAFKQYYLTVLTEGRELSPGEVTDIAKGVLDDKLRGLREAGFRFGLPAKPKGSASSAAVPEPVETLPYAERQLIVLTQQQRRRQKYVPGQLVELENSVSPVRFVASNDVSKVKFPVGHPRSHILYVGHPLLPTVYYLAAEFHRCLFEHKIAEVSRMLRYLGAKHIRIERKEGYGHEVSVKAALSVPEVLSAGAGAEVGHKRSGSSSVMFEARYPVNAPPSLAKDMVWYDHEDLWKEIAQGRLVHGTANFTLDVEYKDDFGVNTNLSGSIEKLGVKIELGGKFSNFQHTVWHVSGEFG